MGKDKFGYKNMSFEIFTEDTVANAIKNLPTDKSSVSNDIQVSLMKQNILLLTAQSQHKL